MLHLGLARLSEEHTCKSGHIHVRLLGSALGVEEPRLLISFSKVIPQGSVMRKNRQREKHGHEVQLFAPRCHHVWVAQPIISSSNQPNI